MGRSNRYEKYHLEDEDEYYENAADGNGDSLMLDCCNDYCDPQPRLQPERPRRKPSRERSRQPSRQPSRQSTVKRSNRDRNIDYKKKRSLAKEKRFVEEINSFHEEGGSEASTYESRKRSKTKKVCCIALLVLTHIAAIAAGTMFGITKMNKANANGNMSAEQLAMIDKEGNQTDVPRVGCYEDDQTQDDQNFVDKIFTKVASSLRGSRSSKCPPPMPEETLLESKMNPNSKAKSSKTNSKSKSSKTEQQSPKASKTGTQLPKASKTGPQATKAGKTEEMTADQLQDSFLLTTPSPTVSMQPSTSAKPSRQPSVSAKPSSSARPSLQPSTSAKPIAREKPLVASLPTGGLKGSGEKESEYKVLSKPSKENMGIKSPPKQLHDSLATLSPTLSLQPSTSNNPSSQPSVSAKPSSSAQPSVTASTKPSTTARPTLSTQPSVSTRPSASLQPSSFPSITGRPITEMDPKDQSVIDFSPEKNDDGYISKASKIPTKQPTEMPAVADGRTDVDADKETASRDDLPIETENPGSQQNASAQPTIQPSISGEPLATAKTAGVLEVHHAFNNTSGEGEGTQPSKSGEETSTTSTLPTKGNMPSNHPNATPVADDLANDKDKDATSRDDGSSRRTGQISQPSLTSQSKQSNRRAAMQSQQTRRRERRGAESYEER